MTFDDLLHDHADTAFTLTFVGVILSIFIFILI